MTPAFPRWTAPAALLLAVISLGFNAYLVAQLRAPERWIVPAVERLLRGAGADSATLRYTVRIPAGTPINLDIPVDERFTIAVDTAIPINTTVKVPLRGPLGTYVVNLPIRANVPLRTRLPLHVRHTFRLRTATRQEIAVPLEIELGDLPLEDLLP